MRRSIATLLCACLAALALGAGGAEAKYPAQGDFGAHGFDVTFTEEGGLFTRVAGSHPFAFNIDFLTNTDTAGGEGLPEGRLRDLFVTQIPGLVGDTTAYERCSTVDFLLLDEDTGINRCPLETTVGISGSAVNGPGSWFSAPVFNLTPPPGVLLRLGFRAVVLNIVVDVSLSPEPPYLPVATVRNTPQLADIYANKTQLWGDPSDPAHDELRGSCGFRTVNELPPDDLDAFQFESETGAKCPVAANPRPFLTLPTNCSGPLESSYEAFSWEGPSALDDGFDAGSALTHDEAGDPVGFTGCGALPTFDPRLSAQPTSRAADSPTGLDVTLGIEDPGLTDVGGRAKSHFRKVLVTLPEGMTANPSQAEGLEVCSEAQLAQETLDAAPGEGCPQASKIGTLEVESPLVEEPVKGALFVAEPFANLAGDSLLAVYVVFKNPKLGIIVKQPVKVTPDPRTGRLVGVADDIPQLPFSSFRLHFREGGRSPLVTPPACGTHAVEAEMTPWSGAAAVTDTSTFELVSGPGGGPCPSGPLPFQPGFAAGTQNNAAGAYSPFSMRLTRRDGDQDLVRFDATLPKGALARLAGVSKCPEAQIAVARTKTGKAELASPSCPLNARIGRVSGGAGVGSQLTYVPGTVYLAGPFGGAPLSAVAIVPAVAGPFDVGTVVYRQALVVDPVTGEVRADGSLSERLPHILAGIPLRVRDIQVHIDRSGFTLNPTSCAPMATAAQLWGGGQNPFSLGDDAPVSRSSRFQASGCASLPFRPRLDLRLKGGTSRGAFPALRAVYRPRPGHANINRLALRFPRSAFIEQGHFRTICTRVQYAADACPKDSIYGHVRAFTPLLDEPLEGPVYLRSSSNNLPDAVFALSGLVDLEVAVRIDSAKGGLRATVVDAPDAPVSRVVVEMQGGKKGLFVNSRNLCRSKSRAVAEMTAQSGRQVTLRPLVRPRCKGKKGRRGTPRGGG